MRKIYHSLIEHNMKSFTQLKTEFEALKERKTELDSGLQTFWTANDHFSVAEILPKLAKIAEQKSSVNAVNLFVAESDIFSITDMIEGNIIICDIDSILL